jgi:aminoglycoside phosphotransferase (APT) family kinase protein
MSAHPCPAGPCPCRSLTAWSPLRNGLDNHRSIDPAGRRLLTVVVSSAPERARCPCALAEHLSCWEAARIVGAERYRSGQARTVTQDHPQQSLDELGSDGIWAMASALLPGLDRGGARLEDGAEHVVVLAPDVGVVRINRTAGTEQLMRRRVELLHRLARFDLPFRVPEPLSEVAVFDGFSAVALSWVQGERHPPGAGDPLVLRRLLEALRAVEVEPLRDVLAAPHGYAGAERWAGLMAEAIACLPADVHDDARQRLDEAIALAEVPLSLVHGDLAGDNVRWQEGRVVAVIDWDWASAWDPAVDAACLAWHGWDSVRSAVDRETYERARVWQRTFGIEQIVASWLRPPPRADVLERTAEWLRRTRRPVG